MLLLVFQFFGSGLLNAENPAYHDAHFEDFKERLSYFQQELSRSGVDTTDG